MKFVRRFLPVIALAIVSLAFGACSSCHKPVSKTSSSCCSSNGSCSK